MLNKFIGIREPCAVSIERAAQAVFALCVGVRRHGEPSLLQPPHNRCVQWQ
ncbi:hypothetical protein NOR51B_156 [Luminiphilus syltensis NOR5-1B]|uniref:Uncharacterized protein n=1 Tax=Luminiphilus syltensis NOR5-1B TaxID=565045 RepID=B8KVG3_9GAMM|nr:hypothetical protein NOR51B_156 [Luminiphilus syltensis NOR5-1B]